MRPIAVCDDEVQVQQNVKDLLARYLTGDTYELYCFGSGEELLQETEKIAFDLIYLDIMMPGLDGIAVAKELRKRGCDAAIVFLTNYDEYLEVGYEAEAFRYRFKPIDEAVFQKDLEAWQQQHNKQHESVAIVTANGVYQTQLRDIVFVEIVGRKVQVHTVNGTYQSVESMTYWEQRLSKTPFLEPYNKILVNMHHVKFFDQTKVIVTGDVELPMSRRKYSEFKTMMLA